MTLGRVTSIRPPRPTAQARVRPSVDAVPDVGRARTRRPEDSRSAAAETPAGHLRRAPRRRENRAASAPASPPSPHSWLRHLGSTARLVRDNSPRRLDTTPAAKSDRRASADRYSLRPGGYRGPSTERQSWGSRRSSRFHWICGSHAAAGVAVCAVNNGAQRVLWT